MNVSQVVESGPDPLFVALRTWHFVYELALASISLSLNGIVVYLALTMNNQTTRNYCRVLLMSVLGDTVYTALNLLTMTIVEIRDGKMYLITTGPFIHSTYPYNMLMCSLWLTGMYVAIMTIMVQFVYRYYALCKNGLDTAKFVLLYFSGIIWCAGQGFAAFICFEPANEENTRILQGHPLYSFDTPTFVTGDPVGACFPNMLVIKGENLDYHCLQQNIGTIFHFGISQVSVVVLYVIIICTGRRIQRALYSEDLNMSKRTQEAQKKLNTVLALQATYPGVIVGIPIVVATVMAELKMDAEWTGMYIVTSISTIPVINALTVLLVIPSFRKRIGVGSKSTVLSSSTNVADLRSDATMIH